MRSGVSFHGAALLTVTGICSQLLGFFYRIALSRLIGAESMGLFQLLMPVYSLLLALTAVGLNSAVSTLTAHRLALGDQVGVKTLTDHCVSWFLLAAGGAGVVLALGSDPISVCLLGDARTQLGLILLAPCLLLTGVENLQKHFFYGTGNVRVPALVELLEQVIRVSAVLALLLRFPPQNPERALGLIVCGMVVSEIFSSCAMSLFFHHAMKGVLSRREPGLGRRVLQAALPVTLTALLNNLLSSADAVLIPRLLVAGGQSVSTAMESYGVLFGMTAPLLSLPTAFIGSLGLVLAPAAARLLAQGRREQALKTLERCQCASSRLLFPMLAFLCAVGPELASALFQEPSAGLSLLPLAVGTALNAHTCLLSCLLNGAGRQKSAAVNCLLSDGVQLLFTLLLVKSLGLGGYLAGYLASSLLALFLNRRAVGQVLGGRSGRLGPVLAPIPAAVLTGLCSHTLLHVLLDGGLALLPALSLCAGFGGGLYLLCLWVCGLLGKGNNGS